MADATHVHEMETSPSNEGKTRGNAELRTGFDTLFMFSTVIFGFLKYLRTDFIIFSVIDLWGISSACRGSDVSANIFFRVAPILVELHTRRSPTHAIINILDQCGRASRNVWTL